MSAIPGEVGASAVQNIGAYGAEVKDLITEVEVVEVATGALRLIPAADCRYAYRQSIFKNEWKGRFIVTHVTYRLGKQPDFRLDYGNLRTELEGKPLTLAAVREAVRRIRAARCWTAAWCPSSVPTWVAGASATCRPSSPACWTA